jgi:hypothetical protein
METETIAVSDSARGSDYDSSLVKDGPLMMNRQRARVAPQHVQSALDALLPGWPADCSVDAEECVACVGSSPA